MTYAFLLPLLPGAGMHLALSFLPLPAPSRTAARLYHAGLYTLTLGCLFQGALEIYGTAAPLVRVYGYLGICLILSGLAHYGVCLARTRKRPK